MVDLPLIELGEIGEFSRGKGITKAEISATGVPCIRYGEIYTSYGNVIFDLNSSASVEAAKKSTPIEAGDIVIAASGETAEEIGKAVAYLGNKPAVAGGDTLVLKCHGQDPTYLAHALNSEAVVRQKSRLGKGNSVVHIHASDLERVKVPLPPLPEQRWIAEILRTWDEALHALTALRNALLKRRNALRAKLFTRAIAKSEKAVFGDFLTESRLPGSDGATARKISVKLYGKGAVKKSENRVGSKNTRYYCRKAGQLIYSKLDFLNGAFAILPDALDGLETTLDLPAFDIADGVNAKWLLEYIVRPKFYTEQLHLARGQRKARRIAPEDFLASPVLLPPSELQDKIALVLTEADKELTLIDRQIAALTRQKRGLMQKLLTGEWRVKVEVE